MNPPATCSNSIEGRSAYVRRWYAVYCKSREDTLAETHLMHQQFRVFRPLMRQQKRCRGRISVVIESLFPRYLFVELDRVEDNWAPIRSTRGVVGLVRTGDRIVSAPKRMIDELKARVGEDGTVALDREKDYRANQRTRVIDGPFAGFEALFLERRGEDRVLVMLNMMQQAQRLVLPDYCIEAA